MAKKPEVKISRGSKRYASQPSIKKRIVTKLKGWEMNGDIIEGVAEQIYNGTYKGTYLQDIYFEERAYYHKIITEKFGGTPLEKKLKDNIDRFLAGKNYQQYSDMKKLLLDENGVKVPLKQFLDNSLKVNNLYNDTWHKVENDLINNQIQVAKKLENFNKLESRDPGRYVLEYIATKDDLTRDTHRALNGFTAPASDPRWQQIMPPWEYNCRCSVKAVRVDGNEKIFEADDIFKSSGVNQNTKTPEGVNKNIVSTGGFFNDKHPYIKTTDREAGIDNVVSNLKGQAMWYGQ